MCSVDTKASEKVSKLITNSTFCKDVAKMSRLHQTYCVEAFHTLIIHFAPKSSSLFLQWNVSNMDILPLYNSVVGYK